MTALQGASGHHLTPALPAIHDRQLIGNKHSTAHGAVEMPDGEGAVFHALCSHSRNRFTNRAAVTLRAPGEGIPSLLSPNQSPRVFSPELAREAGKGVDTFPAASSIGGAL